MANYSIDPAVAQEVAQELVAVTQQLESSLATLQGSVQRFTQANNGQAPDAYARVQQLWDQSHNEMNQALAAGQQRLQEITQNYVAADNQGTAIFGG